MPGLSEVKWHLGRRLCRCHEQAQGDCLLAVEDGAARFAFGHAGLYTLAATGALRRFACLVIPILVETQVPRRAPLQVVDEQKRMRTLPFTVGCGDQRVIELFEP